MKEEPAIKTAGITIAHANVTILEMRVFEAAQKHSKPTQLQHLKAGYREYLARDEETSPKEAGMHASLLAWMTSLIKFDDIKAPATTAPKGAS